MAKAIVDAKLCLCEICGSQFKWRKSKSNRFCGVPCYRAWQRSPDFVSGRIAKPKEYSGDCTGCGSAVYGRVASVCRDGRESDKVFCNRGCYDKYRVEVREKFIAENTRKCKGCEELVYPSNLGSRIPEYCSTACWRKHKQPKPQNCVNCGCLFSAIKWFKGRKRATKVTDAKTCSDKCNIDWIKTNPERKRKISLAFSADKHPNWQGGPARTTHRGYRGPGWNGIAKKIRKRDKYTCQQCGMSEEDHGRALEVHHKIPFGQFQGNNEAANKPSNLVALCKGCHTTADWEWRRNNAIQLGLGI